MPNYFRLLKVKYHKNELFLLNNIISVLKYIKVNKTHCCVSQIKMASFIHLISLDDKIKKHYFDQLAERLSGIHWSHRRAILKLYCKLNWYMVSTFGRSMYHFEITVNMKKSLEFSEKSPLKPLVFLKLNISNMSKLYQPERYQILSSFPIYFSITREVYPLAEELKLSYTIDLDYNQLHHFYDNDSNRRPRLNKLGDYYRHSGKLPNSVNDSCTNRFFILEDRYNFHRSEFPVVPIIQTESFKNMCDDDFFDIVFSNLTLTIRKLGYIEADLNTLHKVCASKHVDENVEKRILSYLIYLPTLKTY